MKKQIEILIKKDFPDLNIKYDSDFFSKKDTFNNFNGVALQLEIDEEKKEITWNHYEQSRIRRLEKEIEKKQKEIAKLNKTAVIFYEDDSIDLLAINDTNILDALDKNYYMEGEKVFACKKSFKEGGFEKLKLFKYKKDGKISKSSKLYMPKDCPDLRERLYLSEASSLVDFKASEKRRMESLILPGEFGKYDYSEELRLSEKKVYLELESFRNMKKKIFYYVMKYNGSFQPIIGKFYIDEDSISLHSLDMVKIDYINEFDINNLYDKNEIIKTYMSDFKNEILVFETLEKANSYHNFLIKEEIHRLGLPESIV